MISEAEFDSSQKRLYATIRNNRNKNYLESVILWLVQASALVLPSPFLIMDRRSEESRKNPRRFSNKILPKPQTIWQPTQRWRMGFAMSMCQGELADRKMRAHQSDPRWRPCRAVQASCVVGVNREAPTSTPTGRFPFVFRPFYACYTGYLHPSRSTVLSQ